MLKPIKLVLASSAIVVLAACSKAPEPAVKEAAVIDSKPQPVATPEPVAAPSKEDLEAKRKQLQAEQLNQYLDEAEALLSVSYQRLEKGEEDIARNSLQSAYSKIQQAKAVDAEDQRVGETLDSLGNKYLSMIEASADDRAYHRAEGFIDDSLEMDIDTTDILAAKEQIGKDILRKARQFDRF
ncbi:hypothetical protein [Oceanicoccus sagamiensis]|uniref:DUF4398 domain-containing protein n=1 Tax=Oceanicoccus sagamiensis TaxID=716816 RepID=A0A1X9N574_9GAMM|nr:hypothetical protein [Oceanicoccus sagamiensis]ARN73260.1 hypothetical protein BST96_03540 [Oceanicoccus sagamiensis]